MEVFEGGRVEIDNAQVEVTRIAQVPFTRLENDSEINFTLYSTEQEPGLITVDPNNAPDTGLIIEPGAILSLNLDGSFSADIGDSFKLIQYNQLQGVFADSIIPAGGYLFEVDYNFNNELFVAVTVIPESGISSLFLMPVFYSFEAI